MLGKRLSVTKPMVYDRIQKVGPRQRCSKNLPCELKDCDPLAVRCKKNISAKEMTVPQNGGMHSGDKILPDARRILLEKRARKNMIQGKGEVGFVVCQDHVETLRLQAIKEYCLEIEVFDAKVEKDGGQSQTCG